jgi:hypothetical protein
VTRRRCAPLLALAAVALASPCRAGDPAFAVLPAAELDAAPFSWAMPLAARPSPEGVTRFLLPPEVLAPSRADLADLRVVDGSSRQWPYLLREDAASPDRPLAVGAPRVEAGRSRYDLGLPVRPLVVDRLTVHVDRAIFDRAYTVTGEPSPGATLLLARGRLVRAAGDPGEIAIPLSRSRVEKLALVVDDGDEAPLPIVAAHARVPLPELVLVAPAGAYTLLTGDPEARPPRYEIAGARDDVLAVRAGDAQAGPVAPNPRHRAPPERRPETMERWGIWGVMVLAVVALGALALRLARREGDGAAKKEGGGPPA